MGLLCPLKHVDVAAYRAYLVWLTVIVRRSYFSPDSIGALCYSIYCSYRWRWTILGSRDHVKLKLDSMWFALAGCSGNVMRWVRVVRFRNITGHLMRCIMMTKDVFLIVFAFCWKRADNDILNYTHLKRKSSHSWSKHRAAETAKIVLCSASAMTDENEKELFTIQI